MLQGSQAVSCEAIRAYLEPTELDIERIEFIVDFVAWISHSHFFRFQLLEPIVGDPTANYPEALKKYGIKGLSVYTGLFDHVDMEVFTCMLCSHEDKDELEDAITHQRTAHFHHYPYVCLGTQTPWYVYSFPVGPYGQYENHIPIQWAALRKPSGANGPPLDYWALAQDGGVSCSRASQKLNLLSTLDFRSVCLHELEPGSILSRLL
jgi:hypothetical protein